MGTTTPSASGGRARQRNRTRRAIVEAAAAMVREGRVPTVAEAAEAADVSRATAYRYLPSQEMLIAEVALFAVGGPVAFVDEDATALPPADAVARLVRRVGEWAYDNEAPLRMILRLSLDPETGVTRPGHRIEWIEQALGPVRDDLDPKTYDKLARALTLLLGIDPIVVMRDIAGAKRREALDTLEWTARALVAQALGEG